MSPKLSDTYRIQTQNPTVRETDLQEGRAAPAQHNLPEGCLSLGMVHACPDITDYAKGGVDFKLAGSPGNHSRGVIHARHQQMGGGRKQRQHHCGHGAGVVVLGWQRPIFCRETNFRRRGGSRAALDWHRQP